MSDKPKNNIDRFPYQHPLDGSIWDCKRVKDSTKKDSPRKICITRNKKEMFVMDEFDLEYLSRIII